MSTTTVRLLRPAGLPRGSLSPVGPALDAAYLLSGLPLGIAAFTVAVTGLSLAGGLAITLLGVPVLIATLWLCRWLGYAERVRAAWLLHMPTPAPPHRAWSGDLLARVKAGITDGAGWRGTLWSLLLLPLGTAGFTVAVALWASALGWIASPLWVWALDEDDGLALTSSASVGWTLLRMAIGVLLVPVAIVACRLLARLTARAALAVTGS